MLFRHGEAVYGALEQQVRVELAADKEPGLLLQHLGQHGEEAVDDVRPVRQAGCGLDVAGEERKKFKSDKLLHFAHWP